ncbi:IucA/IucC family protein [Pseudomonas sp. NPDC007930]|uniref:IucA/IucC family protein n=1 Tax=Pseudomonas sp. NPDC007930 TaxID=3364417 RepID=UPI0036E21601
MAQVVSELAATHALFNCLVKEFALPQGCLRYSWPPHVRGMAPGSYLRALQGGGMPLLVALPEGRQFFVLVDRQDGLGSQRYLGDVYSRSGEGLWACPGFAELAAQVLAACEQLAGGGNPELHAQVLQSQRITAAIVASQWAQPAPRPLRNYLASEQGLWFGHPNHPAPKARLWPAHLAQSTYGPEFGARVRLHLLQVPRAGLQVEGNGLAPAQVLNGFADQRLAAEGQALISLHPVQAQLFLADPRVAPLLASGEVVDLGAQGPMASPTASMRTWYVEGHGYFIKGSLNVRITNCVRKNAWYELRSALVIDRLFQRLHAEHAASLGGAALVREPGSVSWAPAQASEQDAHWFREQTGALLRENFCQQLPAAQVLMAGTLFARDLHLRPLLQPWLQGFSGTAASDQALLGWFERYQALLLRPVLALFFNHGVVMEPHLQNTLVVHAEGQPSQVLLRDFEGVKLTDDLGARHLEAGVPERVRQSLLYPRAQGWQRIAYCLFVNNLAEAVLALSWERPHLAAPMWASVRRQLEVIRGELAGPAPELDALLAGQAIPCKTNLKVRLAAQADRHAAYVELHSPWGRSLPHE